jgi:hypothetical protein
MLAFLPLLAPQALSFDTINKKVHVPEIPPYGTTQEVKVRAGIGEKQIRITYRSSLGPQGGVFEAWRDGKRYFRVLNDGKTLAVLAPQSLLYARIPVDRKHPLDIGKVRLRPVGKAFQWSLQLGESSMDMSKYRWALVGDRPDIIDEVPCRKISYKATGGEVPILADMWVQKGTWDFKYMQVRIGDFRITSAFSLSRPALPGLPGSLAKAAFAGYESVPLSVLRENADAMWAPLPSTGEAE